MQNIQFETENFVWLEIILIFSVFFLREI